MRFASPSSFQCSIASMSSSSRANARGRRPWCRGFCDRQPPAGHRSRAFVSGDSHFEAISESNHGLRYNHQPEPQPPRRPPQSSQQQHQNNFSQRPSWGHHPPQQHFGQPTAIDYRRCPPPEFYHQAPLQFGHGPGFHQQKSPFGPPQPNFQQPGPEFNQQAWNPGLQQGFYQQPLPEFDQQQANSAPPQRIYQHQPPNFGHHEPEFHRSPSNHPPVGYGHSRPYYRTGVRYNRKDSPPKPADYRGWSYAALQPPPHSERFVVLSYNILANYLAIEHRHKLYFHIPHYILGWEWRKRRLMIEFGLWSPDVMCLQEVDKFYDLEQDLAMRGYSGLWKMRTGKAVDGCAIFWRTDKFELRHEEHIEFSKFELRDNVAQICVLESINQRPAENESTSSTSSFQSKGPNNVVICNIHVLYNPKRGDVKLAQVRQLLDRAYAISKMWNEAPVVVCGDFNCTPQSPLYKFISEQKMDFSGIARNQVSGQYSAGINSSRPFTHSGFSRELQLHNDSIETAKVEQRHSSAETDNLKEPWNHLETTSDAEGHLVEVKNLAEEEKICADDHRSCDIAIEVGKFESSNVTSTDPDLVKSEEDDPPDECWHPSVLRNGKEEDLSSIVDYHLHPWSDTQQHNDEQGGGTQSIHENLCEHSHGQKTFKGPLDSSMKLEESSRDVLMKSMFDRRSSDYEQLKEGTSFNQVLVPESGAETYETEMSSQEGGNSQRGKDFDPVVTKLSAIEISKSSTYITSSNKIAELSKDHQESGSSLKVLDKDCRRDRSILLDDACCLEESSDPNFLKELLGEEERELRGEPIGDQEESFLPLELPAVDEGKYSDDPSVWTPKQIEVASGKADCTVAEHHLKLRSAYTEVEDNTGTKDLSEEPQVTSYNRLFMGTVDYIWHSEGLQTVKVLDTIPKHVLEQTPGFPTKKWGSDHLALACEFAFINGFGEQSED